MASQYSGLDKHTRGSIPERVIFGRSSAMEEVRESVTGVAGAWVPVLLLGEAGTGKEVIAREIHRRSPLSAAPFIKFRGTDLIAEHMTGGWGSALRPWTASRPADNSGCTLFIDAVSELALPLQAKLLEFFRDGSPSQTNRELAQQQDMRVICASNRSLEAEVKSGTFRLDLLYRINVVTITVPALSDRKEDIPELAEYFFESWCRDRNRTCPRLPSTLIERLCQHDWPGNIRELEDCMRTYVDTNGNTEVIDAFISKGFGPTSQSKPNAQPSNAIPLKAFKKRLVEQAERDLILRVLHQQQWNRKETAKVLQVSYQTLLHKLKRVGLSRKRRPQSNVADEQVQEREQ